MKENITANGFTACLTCYIRDHYDTFDKGRKRKALLIFPGGAYQYTSEREAEPVAMVFSGMGYQTFVLDYSCAPKGAKYPTALMQGLLAVKYIRDNAEKYSVDPNKIAVLGFSAGGHLAADVSVEFNDGEVLSKLGLTAAQVRPDASVLCYPVITSGEFAHRGSFVNLTGTGEITELTKKLSLETRVHKDVPPTFLWHTWTDGAVPVQNTLLYSMALKQNGIAAEVHIFPQGGHGLSLGNAETSHPDGNEIVADVQEWPVLADRFLRQVMEEI